MRDATTLLVAFLIMPHLTQAQCRATTFRKPLRGHRCITENYTTITGVPQHLCTHACMRTNCSLINYNHEKHYCQLSHEACQNVVEDPEFTVTVVTLDTCLSVTVSPCIEWVSIADVMGSKEVQCDPNSSMYQMGRLVLQQQILVGKFRRDYADVWKDGARYYDANVTEVMQLDPGCTANWVPYTPGDPFPTGTVIGGHLGDPCAGTPIIRGLTSDGDTYRCGYYNAETKLGYLVFRNPETTTAMYILVRT